MQIVDNILGVMTKSKSMKWTKYLVKPLFSRTLFKPTSTSVGCLENRVVDLLRNNLLPSLDKIDKTFIIENNLEAIKKKLLEQINRNFNGNLFPFKPIVFIGSPEFLQLDVAEEQEPILCTKKDCAKLTFRFSGSSNILWEPNKKNIIKETISATGTLETLVLVVDSSIPKHELENLQAYIVSKCESINDSLPRINRKIRLELDEKVLKKKELLTKQRELFRSSGFKSAPPVLKIDIQKEGIYINDVRFFDSFDGDHLSQTAFVIKHIHENKKILKKDFKAGRSLAAPVGKINEKSRKLLGLELIVNPGRNKGYNFTNEYTVACNIAPIVKSHLHSNKSH